jgi:small subunit ribosomal protein S6
VECALRHYEMVIILSPMLSTDEATGSWQRIKDFISERGAEVTQEEQWGMRRLAYPIRKAGQTFLEGNYLLTCFSTESVVPYELEGHLKLSEDVLRYLVVKSDPPKPPPPVAAEVDQLEPSGALVDGITEAPSEELVEITEVEPEPVVAEVTEAVSEPVVAEDTEVRAGTSGSGGY